MGTHAEFRKYAQQCIEIARKTNNQALRENMLEMAETWLGLAGASQIEFEQVRGNGFATHGMGSGQEQDAR
jgi:hypothetical protein